jgi:hypothetical protein
LNHNFSGDGSGSLFLLNRPMIDTVSAIPELINLYPESFLQGCNKLSGVPESLSQGCNDLSGVPENLLQGCRELSGWAKAIYYFRVCLFPV